MSKSKSKSKSKRKTSQPQRTPRLRYLEPATKKDGNPFFALRVPPELYRAFLSEAKRRKVAATALCRELMAEACGVEVDDEG